MLNLTTGLLYSTTLRTTHVGGHDDFNVLFIGAGNIMFGAYYLFPLVVSLVHSFRRLS